MALHQLVRSNYGWKSPVSIKYENLHSFKEVVIILCQSILEIRRISHLLGSAHLTIPLSWVHFDNESRVQERQQMKDQQFCICIFQLIWQFQVAPRSTKPDITTLIHSWLYSRFIEMQSKLRRKKNQRPNQGSNLLGRSFSNWDNTRAPIQFREESQPSILNTVFPKEQIHPSSNQQHQCY